MTATNGENLELLEVRAKAEKLLAGSFGRNVQLGETQELGGSNRSKVYRFAVLDGPKAIPQSVIVKQMVIEAGDSEQAAVALARSYNEWAGLQFLSEVGGDASPTPRFYGGNREAGLIVLEDLGSGTRLDQLLLGDDAKAAAQGLYQLAGALGKLHALTIGRRAEFDQIHAALQPPSQGLTLPSRRYELLVSTFQQINRTFDLSPSLEVENELKIIVDILSDPGPFLAYNHADSCPDNCLLTEKGLKLVDFEFGGWRHALLDGVYGRVFFPTCWCVNSLTDQVVLEMEKHYRAELIKGCPEAADDGLFYRAVVAACIFWAINTCRMDPIEQIMEKDIEWGIASVRARIMTRLEVAARVSAQIGYLKALGASLGTIAAKLRGIWSEQMPLYPAFRQS